MAEPTRDLLSMLERLGEEKRSGALRLTGNDWSAVISFRGGQVSGVEVEPRASWRLGEILHSMHVLSPQRFRRASRVARKKGDRAAETQMLRKGWVAPAVYRRYQERLCVRRVFEFASMVGYRAAFRAAEDADQHPLPTEVAVPVTFIANAVAEQNRAALMESQPLLPDGARFAKTGIAIAHILGGSRKGLPTGALALGLTLVDRRVFFFCNGEIPFRDLSLVLGISPHQLGKSLRTLSGAHAIKALEEGSWWRAGAKGLQSLSRPVMAFVGGILVAGAVLWLALGVVSAIDAPGPSWALEDQAYFRAGAGGARRNLLDALHQFFLNQQIYPASLGDLVAHGHLSRHCFERQIEPRSVDYHRDENHRGFRLLMGGSETRVIGGLISHTRAQKK